MRNAQLPPYWLQADKVCLVKSDGTIAYSYLVNWANGVAYGELDQETKLPASEIRVPSGKYYVVPGLYASSSIAAQRCWRALRDGRDEELHQAGLLSIIVPTEAPPSGVSEFTIDAQSALTNIIDYVHLAD